MLTDNEIIIEIAKLDGWKVEEMNSFWTINQLGSYPSELAAWRTIADRTPPYLSSRDAIIPVIEKIILNKPELFAHSFLLHLAIETCGKIEWYDAVSDAMKFIIATPRQLCVALLKSVGKWKD